LTLCKIYYDPKHAAGFDSRANFEKGL